MHFGIEFTIWLLGLTLSGLSAAVTLPTPGRARDIHFPKSFAESTFPVSVIPDLRQEFEKNLKKQFKSVLRNGTVEFHDFTIALLNPKIWYDCREEILLAMTSVGCRDDGIPKIVEDTDFLRLRQNLLDNLKFVFQLSNFPDVSNPPAADEDPVQTSNNLRHLVGDGAGGNDRINSAPNRIVTGNYTNAWDDVVYPKDQWLAVLHTVCLLSARGSEAVVFLTFAQMRFSVKTQMERYCKCMEEHKILLSCEDDSGVDEKPEPIWFAPNQS